LSRRPERSIEITAFRTIALVVGAIWSDFMPALEALQVIEDWPHHLEAVPFDAVRAAHSIHNMPNPTTNHHSWLWHVSFTMG
jgi:hypothetical protein